MTFWKGGGQGRETGGPAGGPRLRGPRRIRAASFLLGLLLTLLAAAGAVYGNAASENRFEAALLSSVNPGALGADEESLRGFAQDTMAYLNGKTEEWSPRIALNGVAAESFIPDPFRMHMASVKSGFWTAKTALLAGAAVTLCLLLYLAFGGRRDGRSRFSPVGYYWGAALPLLALAGLGGWACLDFDGLWGWLHRTFIQDGIFAMDEPVMRLFPLELFAAYLPPAALWFGLATAAVLALPLLIKPLSERNGTRIR